MPVGFEYGGPFSGQGQVLTGTGSPFSGEIDDTRKQLRDLGAGILHPSFRRNVDELADFCQREFAVNPQRNLPEVREGLIDQCSERLSELVKASMTVDHKWRVAPPSWAPNNFRLPTTEELELWFGVGMETYQYIMDDQGLRNELRAGLWSSFLFTLDVLDKYIVGAVLGLGRMSKLDAGLAFNNWYNSVHFDGRRLFQDLLRDPPEREKIERKEPELLRAPLISDEELYEQFPSAISEDIYWYPGLRRRRRYAI